MEWWQFVLPLVGSALGGALVTGFFGWRKRHWDREDEHARWLRDKKQEAYADFLSELEKIYLTAARLDLQADVTPIEDLMMKSSLGPIVLLASEPLREKAVALRRAVATYADAKQKGFQPGQEDHLNTAFLDARRQAREAFREDLRLNGAKAK